MFFKRWTASLFLGAVILSFWPLGAGAQEDVTVRSGVHPSYSRLVFDWPGIPDYVVAQQGQKLTITFSQPANADIAAVSDRDLPNIKNFKIAATSPLTLTLDIPAESRVRHFSAGDRMVLDVYGAGQESTKLSAVKEDTKKTPPVKPVPDQKTPDKKPPPSEKTPPQAPKAETQKPDQALPVAPASAASVPAKGDSVEVAQPVTPVQNEAVASALTEPQVITLTSTEAMGLAVFDRGGFAWIVTDQPGMTSEPSIAGSQKNLLGTLDRKDMTGGTAFRVALPKGAHIHAEGGGLVWRVIVSPKMPSSKPVSVTRETTPTPSLRWPMTGTRKLLTVMDPVFEDQIRIVTVETPDQFSGNPLDFIPVRTLRSAVGLAAVAKADDLEIKVNRDGVTMTRPQDMPLARPEDVKLSSLSQAGMSISTDQEPKQESPLPSAESPAVPAVTGAAEMSRIYHFDRWEMGGTRALDENERLLMKSLSQKPQDQQTEELVTLAKLSLANDRGVESLGYLRVALMETPELEDNNEFVALRGAASLAAGRPDEAIIDLSRDALKDIGELAYWRSATLGALEDWAQALSVLPSSFDVLAQYPDHVRDPMAIRLAEVALRGGKPEIAKGLLGMMEKNKDILPPAQKAAWAYLMGETQRQMGQTAKAEELWTPLITGPDDYHRAKAGLSLTKLQLDNNKLTPAQAIDRLEGLRYLWRGDELETLINYRLGQVYIQNGDYLKGLSVLRNAASLFPESPMGKEVTTYMTKTFRDLFMQGGADKIKPLDAVTVYDEFKELTPAGAEGDAFIERLAERLVDVDLLGRAGTLLENQVTHRLEGEDKARVALRLAAIRLLDSKPEGALRALDLAQSIYEAKPEGMTEAQDKDIRLLRARALAKMKKVDEAFEVLGGLKVDPNLTRLKVDTAWSAGKWDDAADALNDLIIEEDISLTRPLTPYQVDLILNRAIALNLGGNRVALGSMRERFVDAMKQTDKAQLFDVVTRPRQMGLIGTRENITSLMSEVDMFKDFLESYRKIKPE